MDGMTINHIASIDHGSYEAQIFIFGVCRATGAGSALGCALRSCRWSTELRKAFEDDQLWQDGCGGLGGGGCVVHEVYEYYTNYILYTIYTLYYI